MTTIGRKAGQGEFMKVATRWLLGSLCGLAALAVGCSSSAKKEPEPTLPVGFHYDQPKSKTNPDVVEETDAYYVTRYEKSKMIRVDDKHVRPLVLGNRVALPIYREDEKYYYIRTEKYTPEEIAAKKKERDEKTAELRATRKKAMEGSQEEKDSGPALTEKDFDSLAPERGAKSVHFVKAGAGLPTAGQFRQNIAIADIDGDGHPDIIAPPPRLSSGDVFLILLGDGKGNFHAQAPTIVDESGKPARTLSGYGGVAVADFDGDGKLDVATSSHGGGVNVYLQRDKFQFVPMNKGLPLKNYSTQALAAFDVDGDGRPDLVIPRDQPSDLSGAKGVDMTQVRVFRNLGKDEGWKYMDSALKGGYSTTRIFPFQLEGDPVTSLLMGSNYLGGTYLLWRNDGKGNFKGFSFDAIELSSLHNAVAPGHSGKEKLPAFADLYFRARPGSKLKAGGLSVYVDHNGDWSKVSVWRQKDYGSGHLAAVAMGDLDGDGLDDLVFADPVAKKLRVFFQSADGKFLESPEAEEPSLGSVVADIRLADLDGDGRLDVILAETIYEDRPNDRGGFEVFLNRAK
jgi:hypothetical protein